MTELPETSKEQGQVQIAPTQTNVVKISILQNPLNVEKGKKRDAEAATPISGSSEQPDVKEKN